MLGYLTAEWLYDFFTGYEAGQTDWATDVDVAHETASSWVQRVIDEKSWAPGWGIYAWELVDGAIDVAGNDPVAFWGTLSSWWADTYNEASGDVPDGWEDLGRAFCTGYLAAQETDEYLDYDLWGQLVDTFNASTDPDPRKNPITYIIAAIIIGLIVVWAK